MIPKTTPNILQDLKKKGTFQVNPGEESFVVAAQNSGATQDQIIKGLTIRRQDLQTGITKQTDQGITLNDQPDPTQVDPATGQPAQVDPFGGKSKQEVLKLAFMSGITSASGLKEIATTYDMVNGEGDKTPEQVKADNYAKAQQFISDNPGASREDLQSAIKQHTTLDDGGITSLLNQGQIKPAKDMLTDSDAQTIATNLVKENTGFFTDSTKGKEAAIKSVNEDATLNQAEKDKIIANIDEQYPQGRTLLDKILPGGK